MALDSVISKVDLEVYFCIYIFIFSKLIIVPLLLIIVLHNMANRRHFIAFFALFVDNMIIYCPMGLDGENSLPLFSVHCPIFLWTKFHLTDPHNISL